MADLSYRCRRCDVLGYGHACWCCTLADRIEAHPLGTNGAPGPDYGLGGDYDPDEAMGRVLAL